jgi:peptidyl-prolyl cis-trans isomerase SurA
MLKYFVSSIVIVLSAFSLYAQQSQVLDKIIATVGREIVLQSDIEGRIAMFLQQNPKVNPSDPELRKQVLESLINERLMVTKAVEDSIAVMDEEINQSLDFMMQNLMQTYGSEKRVRICMACQFLVSEKIIEMKFVNNYWLNVSNNKSSWV